MFQQKFIETPAHLRQCFLCGDVVSIFQIDEQKDTSREAFFGGSIERLIHNFRIKSSSNRNCTFPLRGPSTLVAPSPSSTMAIKQFITVTI